MSKKTNPRQVLAKTPLIEVAVLELGDRHKRWDRGKKQLLICHENGQLTQKYVFRQSESIFSSRGGH
jgi:hypothetical protein